MISTSAAFQTAANAYQRNPEVVVAVHFGKKPYIPTATATSTDPSTAASQAAIGRIRVNTFSCTGSYINAAYANKHKGWWSLTKADSSGNFSTFQELVINYGENITTSNFWFIADPFYYPVNFDVMIYTGSSWVLETSVIGNTNFRWAYRSSAARTFSQTKIVVKKVSTVSDSVRILHFGAVTTVLFEKDDVIDFKILEETSPETNSPIGNITSNELTLTLNNELRWFTPDNTDSPFYGLIKPKIQINPYAGFETTTDSIEFVPLGVFKVLDWDSHSDSLDSSLVANDRMYDIINQDIPMKLPVKGATTLKDLFIYLFTSIGLTSSDYNIDSSISLNIGTAWIPQGKAGEVLQKLSEAGNCSVFADRFNTIRVKNNKQSGASIASITDNDQIVAINNPQRFLNVYSTVKVDYNSCYLSDPTQIALLSQTVLKPGVNVFKDIQVSGPLGNILMVKMAGSTNCKTTKIEFGTWSMNVEITNSGVSNETLDIEIIGRTIELTRVQKTAISQPLIDLSIDRTFTVQNEYIQNETDSQNYANSLIGFVSDAKAFYSIDVRCNPSFELLDLITVQSTIDHISSIQLVIIRNEITYDGGLSGSLYVRKVIT